MTEALREALLEMGPPPGPCSTNDELWSLLEGDLPRDRAAAVANHSARCSTCAFALQLGREIPRQRAQAVRRWPWAAAMAIAASVLVIVWPRPLAGPGPALREADRVEIQALAGEGQAPRGAPLVLRWTAIPGARYSVHCTTEDLTPLWSKSGLIEAQVEVPARFLSKTARLAWRVTAQKPDGSTATSKAFLVALR